MIDRTQVAAVLMTGGGSRRMGRDKAFLACGDDGRPLWDSLLELMQSVEFGEVIISARPEQAFAGARAIVDATPDRGPLGGLSTCFHATKAPFLLPLAVDMPGITRDLLERLLENAEDETGAVYLDEQSGFFEPFPGLYPRNVLPLVEDCLASGSDSMQELIRESVSKGLLSLLTIAPGESESFRNLNTPEDL